MIKTIVLSWTILFIAIFIGAYGVYYYEQQDKGATIITYEDALWWSVNVSSAVGDCNICPITTGGRIISVILMFVGYALFSINIAVIANILKQVEENAETLVFTKRQQ